eukprot:COSAG06_NODE_29002_length_564_cov_0.795699_1_plen_147_part_10
MYLADEHAAALVITLCLSAFPMFVPSLSWQNDHLYYTMASQKDAFSFLPRGPPPTLHSRPHRNRAHRDAPTCRAAATSRAEQHTISTPYGTASRYSQHAADSRRQAAGGKPISSQQPAASATPAPAPDQASSQQPAGTTVTHATKRK